MKIKPIGSNQTELEIGDWTILVSYETVVAAIDSSGPCKLYRTSVRHSVTTSKHINQWFTKRHDFDLDKVQEADPTFFETLVRVP